MRIARIAPFCFTLVSGLCAVSLLFTGCAKPSEDLQYNVDPTAIGNQLESNQQQQEEQIALRIAAEKEQAEAAKFGVTTEQLRAGKALLPSTQREQVASLMMVGVRGFDDALFALQQGAGGIFIGSWTDPALLTDPQRDLAVLRQVVGRPFSVSIDAEGGRVQRQPALLGAVPAPRDMAQSLSPEQTQQLAFDLGSNLRARGVTVDFAPVLDLDSRPASTAIGDRSFSNDPVVASEYATAFARGLSDAGIRPVYKHFPGHGRASGDSHFENVTSPPLSEMLQSDIAVYGPALRQSSGAVMVGHVSVPGLGDASPSSLNPAAYRLLRDGSYPGGQPFSGVIYTDDLSGMKAVSAKFSTPAAVRTALSAGADCALWISTNDLSAAIDAADSAVIDGSYDKNQMLDSALRLKLQLALYEVLS